MTTAAWTDAFHTYPWLGSVVWIALHCLDYWLTIYGALLYRAVGHRFVEFSGSYELNPVFQRVVDRGQWISRRFILTLLAPAALFWLLAVLDTSDHLCVLDPVLGAVIFTRVGVITLHLTNIWLFRRADRYPGAVTGHIRYDRPTTLLISALRYAFLGAVVGIAACIAPNGFLIGGAGGFLMLALMLFRLARKVPTRDVAPPTGGDADEPPLDDIVIVD